MNASAIGDLLKSIVPISRFNKGEANRIFDEVAKTGFKVVVKNNTPACVLVSPDDFAQMLEDSENYALLLEATKRMEHVQQTIPLEQIVHEFGITKEELDATKVKIE